MDFKFIDKNLIEEILKKNNRSNLIQSNYNMALDIFTAAPDFDVLSKITCLNLKKYLTKKDNFSIRLCKPDIRLVFKKLTNDSISIITIII